MTGVEILNQSNVYHSILPAWCGAVGFVCFLIFLIAFVWSSKPWISVLFLVCTLASATLGGLGLTSDKNNIDYIEYKITIDDSVLMTEFLDKYEILDQEGKICTVKEKEQ